MKGSLMLGGLLFLLAFVLFVGAQVVVLVRLVPVEPAEEGEGC